MVAGLSILGTVWDCGGFRGGEFLGQEEETKIENTHPRTDNVASDVLRFVLYGTTNIQKSN